MKNYFVEVREQVSNLEEVIEMLDGNREFEGDQGPFTFTEAIHAITKSVAYFATRKYSIASMNGVEFGWHCESPEGGLITIELMQMGGK